VCVCVMGVKWSLDYRHTLHTHNHKHKIQRYHVDLEDGGRRKWGGKLTHTHTDHHTHTNTCSIYFKNSNIRMYHVNLEDGGRRRWGGREP